SHSVVRFHVFAFTWQLPPDRSHLFAFTCLRSHSRYGLLAFTFSPWVARVHFLAVAHSNSLSLSSIHRFEFAFALSLVRLFHFHRVHFLARRNVVLAVRGLQAILTLDVSTDECVCC